MGGVATLRQKDQSHKPTIGSVRKVRLNDQEYSVEVIDNRETESGELETYIHFTGQDTRLDEWIRTSLLLPIDSKVASTTADVNTEMSLSDISKKKRRAENNGTAKAGDKSNSVVVLNDSGEAQHPRNINSIIFGRYEIGTWYHSPYPEEYGHPCEKMYICEHCLKYMHEENTLRTHKVSCRKRSPPGDVVYQQGVIKIFRIDGKIHKLYSQNLCLMSKLFLDHKSVYYDIEGFMFYVLTEQDPRERRMDTLVGYFSKEKISYENNNLACIMILPPYQRKGYGKLMIEFSYELARHENQIGSPEKPLSDLGYRGYRSYWASVLLRVLAQSEDSANMTIRQLSQLTYIHVDDIIDTMKYTGLFKYVRETEISDAGADAIICITKSMIEDAINARVGSYGLIDPSRITWST